jgi:hypothetical protein
MITNSSSRPRRESTISTLFQVRDALERPHEVGELSNPPVSETRGTDEEMKLAVADRKPNKFTRQTPVKSYNFTLHGKTVKRNLYHSESSEPVVESGYLFIDSSLHALPQK